jgi:hypothetical protein
MLERKFVKEGRSYADATRSFSSTSAENIDSTENIVCHV